MQSVRFSFAVVLSVVSTDALWRGAPGSLRVSTDVVGYPIFADFDVARYLDRVLPDRVCVSSALFRLLPVPRMRGLSANPRIPADPTSCSCSGPKTAPHVTGVLAYTPRASAYTYLGAVGRGLRLSSSPMEVSSTRAPGASVPTRVGGSRRGGLLGRGCWRFSLAPRMHVRNGVNRPDGPVVSRAHGATIVVAAIVRRAPTLRRISLPRALRCCCYADHRVVYRRFPAWLFVLVGQCYAALWFSRQVSRGRFRHRSFDLPGSARKILRRVD